MLVFSGTHKALMLSVKTSRVVTSELAERELKQAVGMALGEEASCKANLIPRADLPSTIPESPNKGLYGTKTTRDSGAGEVLNLDAGTVSLRRGFEIKGDLRIVKMELRQWDKTPADPDKRVFVVWYEKLHLGPAEEGKSCTAGSQASDQDGCYFSRCELEYKLNTAKDGAETCQIVGGDCAGVSVAGGGGGAGAECYEIDKTGAEGGKILIGCGRGGQDGIGTTAIGFEAGKVNTGASNIFIGLQAGKETTSGRFNTFIGSRTGEKNKTGESNVFIGGFAGTNSKGAKNVFIGYKAGEQVTTGANNVFIGHQAGSGITTKSNQINIGGIVQASQKQIPDPADNTKQIQIGVINVCNAQGEECMPLSKNTLKCPVNQYFRGIDTTKTPPEPICQEENFCPLADPDDPQSRFFFGPPLIPPHTPAGGGMINVINAQSTGLILELLTAGRNVHALEKIHQAIRPQAIDGPVTSVVDNVDVGPQS